MSDSMWIFDTLDEARIALAAKDLEIAALREALKGTLSYLSTAPASGDRLRTERMVLAALSASPAPGPAKSVGSVTHIPSSPLIVDDAPDPAEADENMGLAGARAIGEARTSSLRSFSWENRYDFNAPGPAEAMRDGAIYAAVSRAKDPKAYDKMLDEVTADARAVLAAEAMRAKCEAIARDMRGWMQPRDVADAIAALKGNGEGR